LQQQHNKSFNLTSPALRGGRHSGAVKRAPQVNSNPLGRLITMKLNNFTLSCCTLFLFAAISGCSSTYRITTGVSKANHNTITKEAFIDKICGKCVILTLRSGQLKNVKLFSLQDSCISFVDGHDTLGVPIREIRSVSDQHQLLGAIIGLPLGFVFGGLVAGLTVGIVTPPTTIYEFGPSSEIYEKQNAP
jgi:hypothetical protein